MKHSSERRDAEEINLDPAELWCQLGLLVIESRQPDESAKGWREGPHCPAKKPRLPHKCSPNANAMCKRKEAISREIRSLGRNNVPVCIEVVMLPECGGHDHKADIAHGAMRENYLLLEQWKFQMLPKRSEDVVMGISSLFQAVRSYLYFSQLCAWLNQTKGTAPKAVQYRVSPPAEFCTSTFQEPPELHRFPICNQQHYAIQVTVAALPRQDQLILLSCPGVETHFNPTSNKEDQDKDTVAQQRRNVDLHPSRPETSTNVGTYTRNFQEATQTGYTSPRRKLASPSADMMLGACASSRALSPCFSPRSGSPCGATCGSYTNYSDMKLTSGSSGADEGGLGAEGGGGVVVQSMYEHRDHTLMRSKTYKDFHSDDSSDCSESSTVVSHSQRSSESPIVFNHPRLMHTSSSMQTIRERAASPKFYLPYSHVSSSTTSTQPSIERVSSPSSSSDSSQYGASRETVLSPHRPSPPIDLYMPQRRDSIDSLSRKLATKLSFEPLPAFELEAHVSKSVQLDLPIASPFKPEERNLESNGDYSYSQNVGHKAPPPPHVSQKLKAKRCLDLSSKDSGSVRPKTIQDGHYLQSACSNGADTNYAMGYKSSHHDQAINGNSQSVNGQQKDYKPVQNGASIQNGAGVTTETNGYHGYDTELQHNRFQVPKTPEKPLKTILSRHHQNLDSNQGSGDNRHIPTEEERVTFRKALSKSTAAVFSKATALPLQSSPAPIKRLGRKSFDFDENLICAKAIKNSVSCVNLEQYENGRKNDGDNAERARKQRLYSASAPASTNSLLGNFEESLLNGRIEPCGAVNGFRVDIGASGSFCPSHVTLPVTAFFFKLSEDNAPSPYLGHVNLESVGKRGYHIPSKGTIQVTLFNPNSTVVKMFVVTYDLADMPPCCTTFLRQRTVYRPVSGSKSDTDDAPVHLKYLIHLRVASTKSKKLYLHSDIRLIFARDKFEYDSRIANYEYRSLTEGPVNPKYSPKK